MSFFAFFPSRTIAVVLEGTWSKHSKRYRNCGKTESTWDWFGRGGERDSELIYPFKERLIIIGLKNLLHTPNAGVFVNVFGFGYFFAFKP